MDNAWQRYIDLAAGIGDVTRKHAETVVKALVKHGEVAADRAERAVDDLLERSEANRRLVAALVRTETERAVSRLGLAQQAEVDRLRAEVAALRERFARMQGDAPATGAQERVRKRTQKTTKKAAQKGSRKTTQSASRRATGSETSTTAAAASGPPTTPTSPEEA